MIFGGVPKYLEDVDTSRSFSQNMDHLCFSENGVMVNEIDPVFVIQFREATTYKRIVRCLLQEPLTLDQISKKINMASGGGLKVYLENLILSDMVESVVSLGRKENSKDRRYQLSDEYLIFYFKYVEPHLKLIHKGAGRRPFERLVATKWKPLLKTYPNLLVSRRGA